MRIFFRMLCSLLIAISLTACNVGDTQLSVTTASIVPPPPIVQDAEVSSENATDGLILSESLTTSKEPSATLEPPSLKTTPPPSVASSTPTQDAVLPKSPPPVQAETKSTPTPSENTTEAEVPKGEIARSMQITIENKIFTATLAKNAAVDAFIELMQNAPIVINMSDYSGFEKVGSLGTSLPTSNSNITTEEGDIVLYNGNQIVVFYGSHSWSYTRLGKIDDPTKWKETLGDGDVTITFSIK